MVEFYLLTFPRFPLRKKEHKSYFGKNRAHDLRTSRCAAYLLDHSGDERIGCILGAGKEEKSKTDKKVDSKGHRHQEEAQGLTRFYHEQRRLQ